MRTFRNLLIALLFLLGSTAALATSYGSCCHRDDCTVVQCAAAGCLSAAPLLAVDTPRSLLLVPSSGAVAGPVQSMGPLVYRDIWTPPD
jgi:hypothetical protein